MSNPLFNALNGGNAYGVVSVTLPRPFSSISRDSRATPWNSCKANSTAGK